MRLQSRRLAPTEAIAKATRQLPSHTSSGVVLFSFMPASRAVRDFVRQAKDLLRLLEREGHKLSDIDLHTLIMHLHLLEIKSTNTKPSQNSARFRRATSGSIE